MQNKFIEQDSFISLRDIVKIIIRRKKILLWTTLILSLLSVVTVFITYKNKAIYQQVITLPYYYSTSSQAPQAPQATQASQVAILNMKQVFGVINSQILPDYLASYQASQLAAQKQALLNTKNYTITPISLDAASSTAAAFTTLSKNQLLISLSTAQSKSAKATFSKSNLAILTQLQSIYTPQVVNYITQTTKQLELLNEVLPQLNNLRALAQKATNANESPDNIKDLYLASISGQNQYTSIYNLKLQHLNLQNQLNTLNKSFTMSAITVLPELQQVSRLVLLILSLFISLFIGFIAVFIVEFAASYKEES
jgi:hypothetical protein